MVVAAPSVMTPPQVLSFVRLRNAPLPSRPLPLKLSASFVTKIPPCNCNTAPLATVVPRLVPPRAEGF